MEVAGLYSGGSEQTESRDRGERMSFHILHSGTLPKTRWVRCDLTGRDHRHKSHKEEYARAACGQVVVNGREQFCNISIADPINWSYDWCVTCVEKFPWKPEAAKRLRAKGLLTSPSPQE